MKIFIIKFILWFYENHIQEDWDVYKKPLKIIVWPAWLLRSIIYWIISPLFIPQFIFKNSVVYKQWQTTGSIPTPEEMKKMQIQNKKRTQDFINRKFGKR